MILTGDCIAVMQGMEPDSVDSIVTDPPYGLAFMGKSWDTLTPQKFGTWCCEWGREALRVSKPGGYLLAFGGTRTHHRLVCGLEDAGWIIRDELDWIYASGFPKGKANLKPAHEPIVLARKPGPLQPLAIDECRIPNAEGDDFEKAWDKPVNVSAHGPVGHLAGPERKTVDLSATRPVGGRWPSNVLLSDPALFDERNAEVVGSGATAGDFTAGRYRREDETDGLFGFGGRYRDDNVYGDSGGYSRFFIVPKADRADREPVVRGQLAKEEVYGSPDEWGAMGINGEKYRAARGGTGPATTRENAHPTVKPVDLMRHLVRLVTPTGGTVLDCFLGSGSTAIAAEQEGFQWVGIEKEAEYVKIAEARLYFTQKGLGI